MQISEEEFQRILGAIVDGLKEIHRLRMKQPTTITSIQKAMKKIADDYKSHKMEIEKSDLAYGEMHARLEVLHMLGGKGLLERILDSLEKHSDNDAYALGTKFTIACDGLGEIYA